MRSVCIGIPIQSEPQRVRVTLDSLQQSSSAGIEVVVIPDDADATTRQFLARIDAPVVTSGDGVGTAACFNRLAAYSQAEVIVLLESGTRVGRSWLEHLLRGLDDDRQNGLAGPSTNNCWNEQGVFPRAGASEHDVTLSVSEAEKRFGKEVRTLEPLYSLADFCYVVRREVIEAIGAADERYSFGPCWEMDYNIRAARAGWRGVWVGAAYVHRAPFTQRRRLEESRRFETSKQLYQDKFCGARLRGEKTDYRPHCRGDACANFAPADLIEIKRANGDARASVIATKPPEPPRQQPARIAVSSREPLVTCIMPTSNRRRFIPQALRCFLRQDYSNLELLVVDDGADPISDCLPENDRIRYLHLDRKLTIGAKRNLACER